MLPQRIFTLCLALLLLTAAVLPASAVDFASLDWMSIARAVAADEAGVPVVDCLESFTATVILDFAVPSPPRAGTALFLIYPRNFSAFP